VGEGTPLGWYRQRELPMHGKLPQKAIRDGP
jgi:hypothetical protein